MLLIIKENTTKYISSSIDTSKYLTVRNIFYKKPLCIKCQKHTGESLENPSIQVFGNVLIDQKRSVKIGNLKGVTKTTLLNNAYSYHNYNNKVLKFKESTIENGALNLNITEECCSPPKQKITRLMVLIYDRNKYIIHQ